MMTLTPRHRRALGTVAVAAVAAVSLSACSGGSGGSSDGPVTLWTWSGGLGPSVLDSAKSQFPADKIEVTTIGDDVKQKLVTVFTGRSGIPTITGVKGEDMPYFLQQADLFTDLKTLGIDDKLADFPAWKLAEATTPDGKLIGLPTDIGPTALYYRTDVLAAAGLPTDPAAVAAATKTWDDYFAFGEKLKAATGAYLEVSLEDVFTKVMGQGETKMVSKDGEFLGDSAQVKKAWDTAIEANQRGLVAGIQQRARHLGQVERHREARRAGQHRRIVPHDPRGHGQQGRGDQGRQLPPGCREPGDDVHRGRQLPLVDRRAQRVGPAAARRVLRRPGDHRRVQDGVREHADQLHQPDRQRTAGPLHHGARQRAVAGQGPAAGVERRPRRRPAGVGAL